MIELDSDYDMTVENMDPLTDKYTGWSNKEGDFFSPSDDDFIKMSCLLNDSGDKQIFKMKDGRFVLEVENDELEVEYFYSYDINDLL